MSVGEIEFGDCAFRIRLSLADRPVVGKCTSLWCLLAERGEAWPQTKAILRSAVILAALKINSGPQQTASKFHVLPQSDRSPWLGTLSQFYFRMAVTKCHNLSHLLVFLRQAKLLCLLGPPSSFAERPKGKTLLRSPEALGRLIA